MLFKLEQIRADEASDDERECNRKFMESRKSHKLKCCGWRYLFGNRREQVSEWVSEWEIPEIPKKSSAVFIDREEIELVFRVNYLISTESDRVESGRVDP